MTDFISQLLAAGTGSTITGGIISLLVRNYLDNRDKERDQLANDVQRLSESIRILKDERVQKIEHKIECHISDDKSQKILTIVENISNRQEKIDSTVQHLLTENAKLAANYENTYNYIDNLDKSFQAHKTQDIRIMTQGKK
jgi:hypothetical protein